MPQPTKEQERIIVIQSPLLDQMAQQIKDAGWFEANLSASQLLDLTTQAIDHLRGHFPGINAGFSVTTAEIKPGKDGTPTCILDTNIAVKSPIQVAGNARVNWKNDQALGKLRTSAAKLTYADTPSQVLAKSFDLETRIKAADPNALLGAAIKSQMQPRGVNVTGAAYTLSDNSLQIKVSGTTI